MLVKLVKKPCENTSIQNVLVTIYAGLIQEDCQSSLVGALFSLSYS